MHPQIISQKNLYPFNVNNAGNGQLCSLELLTLPFNPLRSFVVKNVPEGTSRGGHAHYNGKQLLVCLRGRVKVYLNDGISDTDETHHLTENDTLYVPSLIWDRYIFKTRDTVMLVFSSTQYDRKDYIEDFGKFQEIKRNMHQ